ncbi:MAG: 23S rRNA (adenine(2030)-N(6))-methyltransferase RlmJ [Gammaproteobacteria bacterium]|nr:23S rRNA (adenine(2030)-N(6))-methyltransferase RlmJ [Gammaproteobacteria bacterium]
MQYRHIYHAGNFADVFKHCILIALINFLHKKSKPFLFLDTHAGIANYDLTTQAASVNQEFRTGILRILDHDTCPQTVKIYQDIVQKQNPDKKSLHYYPGSPQIAYSLLDKQDQMVLVELHTADAKALKKVFMHDKRVAVHHADGFQSLKAFLPPKVCRGLILIDPAYEQKTDFNSIIVALKIAAKRFPIGIYLIWFPIKDYILVNNFYQELTMLDFKNILCAELALTKKTELDLENIAPATKSYFQNRLAKRQDSNLGLTNCGLVIINPPWQFELELSTITTWLKDMLFVDESASSKISWLKKAPT